jgi:hypothetical protein
MFDALVEERIKEAGGPSQYARQIGVDPSTLWRWAVGERDLFSGQQTEARQRFFDSLCFPEDALRQFAGMTVNEACVRLIEAQEKR